MVQQMPKIFIEYLRYFYRIHSASFILPHVGKIPTMPIPIFFMTTEICQYLPHKYFSKTETSKSKSNKTELHSKANLGYNEYLDRFIINKSIYPYRIIVIT